MINAVSSIETPFTLSEMNKRVTFNRYLPLALTIVTALALGSCGTYSRVSERRPPLLSKIQERICCRTGSQPIISHPSVTDWSPPLYLDRAYKKILVSGPVDFGLDGSITALVLPGSNLLSMLFPRSIRTSSGYRFEHFKTISNSPRFRTLLLVSFLICIGFHSKETANGSAISSLETRDLEANAHAPNYSPTNLVRREFLN